MKKSSMKKGPIINPESSRKFQVTCRVRPLQESEPGQDISISAHPPSITIRNHKASNSKEYTFHRVYSDTVKQDDFTRAMTDQVYLKCLDTRKGCLILSYGVTNSGKTYTILGTGKEPGILPALVAKFEVQMPDKQIKIRALEIYNDDLYCLRSGEKLPIKNNQFLDGCEYEKITIATSRTIIEDFIRSRKTVETKANRCSSRSHAIFMIKCGQYHIGITDLAGNQRLDTNLNLNEACSINKNLLALGRCIHALRDGQQLPYRESKLTLALMEYFKPHYKIFMITHINRTGKMFHENINVLDYATESINVKHINPLKNKSITLGAAKEKKKVTEMKEKREREEVSAEYFKEEDYKGMKFLEGQKANQCVSPDKSKKMWLDKLSAESMIKLKQMFLEEQRLEKEEKMKDAATEMGPSMKKQSNIPSTNGQSQEMITPSKLPSNPQSDSYLKEVMKTPSLIIQSSFKMITKFEEIANSMMESFRSMIGKQQEQAPKVEKQDSLNGTESKLAFARESGMKIEFTEVNVDDRIRSEQKSMRKVAEEIEKKANRAPLHSPQSAILANHDLNCTSKLERILEVNEEDIIPVRTAEHNQIFNAINNNRKAQQLPKERPITPLRLERSTALQSKMKQTGFMTLDDLEIEWEAIKKVDMKKAEQAKELAKRQKDIEGDESDEGKRKVEKSRGRPLTNAEQKSKKNNN